MSDGSFILGLSVRNVSGKCNWPNTQLVPLPSDQSKWSRSSQCWSPISNIWQWQEMEFKDSCLHHGHCHVIFGGHGFDCLDVWSHFNLFDLVNNHNCFNHFHRYRDDYYFYIIKVGKWPLICCAERKENFETTLFLKKQIKMLLDFFAHCVRAAVRGFFPLCTWKIPFSCQRPSICRR